jgi:hypothetical protein
MAKGLSPVAREIQATALFSHARLPVSDGLQSRVPAPGIALDFRTLEPCKTMRVPRVRAKGVVLGDPHQIPASDPAVSGSHVRSRCDPEVAFSLANELDPAAWLRAIAGSVENKTSRAT